MEETDKEVLMFVPKLLITLGYGPHNPHSIKSEIYLQKPRTLSMDYRFPTLDRSRTRDCPNCC
jgi:hypothetical protein